MLQANSAKKAINSPPQEEESNTEDLQIIVVPDVGEKPRSNVSAVTTFKTPVQDKLKSQIANLQTDVLYLTNKRQSGTASDKQLGELNEKRANLKELESELKKKEGGQRRQQIHREQFKRNIEELLQINPEAAAVLKKKSKVGRPRIEDKQPELLQAIVDIATHGAGADERRRSENIRTIQTLDELTRELQTLGFDVRLH